MEYDHPFGEYTFEVEGMPCLGTFVIMKQRTGRIVRMKSKDFFKLDETNPNFLQHRY